MRGNEQYLRGRTPGSLAQAGHDAAERLRKAIEEDGPVDWIASHRLHEVTLDVQAVVDQVLYASDNGRSADEGAAGSGELREQWNDAVVAMQSAEVARGVHDWSKRSLAERIVRLQLDASRAETALAAHRCAPPAPEVVSGADAAAHRYLSTGCLHGEHGYCQAMTGQQGEKRPGRCKFCDARCVCECHHAAPPEPPLAVGDQVTTAAELDRLPVGTVVVDATTDVAVRAEGSWHVVGLAGDFGPSIVDLPARVLDLPTS